MVNENEMTFTLRSGPVTVSGTAGGNVCIDIEETYVSCYDEAMDIAGELIRLLTIVREINGQGSRWMIGTQEEDE